MIIVFGKDGQVANALKLYLPNDTIFVSSKEVDFLDETQVVKCLNKFKPDLIINASAYTAVDLAETEQEKCLQINSHILITISDWAQKNKSQLIHFSTDYVFSGEGEKPWIESDSVSPVNFYGYSKLEGENNIRRILKQHYIFRISWVYSPWGKNFPKTIAKLAQERDELKIISDQFGSPTDAREVALFISLIYVKIFENKIPPGTYHLHFQDYVSWYDIALKTIGELKKMGKPIKAVNIKPITTSEYPTAAKRPLNSRLESEFDFIKDLCENVKKISLEKKLKFFE